MLTLSPHIALYGFGLLLGLLVLALAASVAFDVCKIAKEMDNEPDHPHNQGE